MPQGPRIPGAELTLSYQVAERSLSIELRGTSSATQDGEESEMKETVDRGGSV